MAHKPRWKNGGVPKGGLLLALGIAAVCMYFFDKMDISLKQKSQLQSLVDFSVLKVKPFDAEVKEIELPKTGIKAYLLEEGTNPIVSISFLFKGAGSVADIEKQSGIANFAASMLGEGTKNKNSQDFKKELESLGIHLSFSAGIDDVSGTLITPKEYLPKAVEALKNAIIEPRLDDEDIKVVRDKLAAILKKQKENPALILNLAKNEMLYGLHPYGRNPLGTEKTLLSISGDDIRDVIRQRLAKDNLIVGVAGDVSEQEVVNYVDEIFSGLPPKSYLQFVRDIIPNFGGARKHLQRKLKQTIAAFSGKGTARKSDDFYPLYVANYIFGGAGLNSRLSQEIREKAGLVYSIYSYISLNDKSQLLNISFSTTKENYAKVVSLLEKEMLKMQKGITEQELNMAKNYMIGSYNLRFADIDAISAMLVYMQKDNLGLDFLQKRNEYVANVTLKEVNEVAKKYFNINNMSAIDIGE